MRYFFGQVGNINSADVEYNPYTYLNESGAEEFLYKLINSPEKYSNYENIDFINGFLKTEIIKNIDGCLYLNIPTLFVKDKEKIISVSQKYAEKLYDSVLTQSNKIEKLCGQYKFNKNISDKYMFIVICCICLDWQALELLEKWEFLSYRVTKPGKNNEYTLTGHAYMSNNESDPVIEPYYANSSSAQIYDYILSSFGSGNNSIIRQCFPDILWKNQGENIPEYYKNYLSGDINKNINFAKQFAAEITMQESKFDLLYEQSGCKKNGVLSIPVFTQQDSSITDTIKEIIEKVLFEWISNYISEVECDLFDITPLKNNFAFADVFNYIWHNIFGICNGMLCKNGIVFNPKDNELFNDYLPFIIYK